MAAKSSSTVGLIHFALMLFVIFALGFGVAWYMTYSEYTTALEAHKETENSLRTQQTLVGKQRDELAALKTVVGHTQEEVGTVGTDDRTTVLWNVQNDVDTFGEGSKRPNVHLTMEEMRAELDRVLDKRAELEAQVRDQQSQMLTMLESRYQDQVETAETKADQEGQRAILADQQRNEQVRVADAELKQRRLEVSQLQIELDRVNEEADRQRSRMQTELDLLTQKNTQLREEIDNIRQVSFEQPDGVVRKVDHTTGLVWINLGTADDLPPRTTFSVYTKTHHGVGRGEDDIKGSIEVTRIIGPHLAEARILDEDYSSPIASTDPVYTPIWSPGRKHKFAVVGLIDIDGNEISDREQFRELVQAAGGELDVEVDDEGRMTGDGLTVHHKFLVMGEVPDYTLEIDLERKEQFRRMMEERDKLLTQARINGVRIVSLDLFLEWAGYRPQRRLWRPGDEVPWTLKGGGRSTGVNETADDLESSGQTSKVYGDERRYRRQESSSGQTSKTFGGYDD